MFVKRSILILIFCWLNSIVSGQGFYSGPLPLSAPQKFVQSKNYYLLSLLENSLQAKRLLESDPVLSKFAVSKTDSLR